MNVKKPSSSPLDSSTFGTVDLENLNHTSAVHFLIVARSINGEVGREAAYQFIYLAIGELMKYPPGTNVRQTATQINIFKPGNTK